MFALVLALLVAGSAFFALSGLRTVLATAGMRPSRLVWGTATLALLMATPFAPGAPSGTAPLDAGYKLLVGVICAWAASLAHRWVAVVCAPVALVAIVGLWAGGGTASNLVFASAALGAAIGAGRSRNDERSGLIFPMLGALLANAVLRLPTSLPTRFPTVVAAAATAILCAIAVVNSTRRTRRWTLALFGAALTITGIGAVGGGIAALSARADANAGIQDARDAIDAVRAGDVASAQQRLGNAATALRTAHDRLDGPSTFLANLLPILGPNLSVVRELTARGADVAARGAKVIAAADPLTMRASDGRIDVERIARLREPLLATRQAIREALTASEGSKGPWVAPTLVRQTTKLRAELLRSQASTADASAMVDALPSLLGSDGPRRYLVVVPTPAEARGSGGLIGNYGEISATDGRLRLERFGRTSELIENGTPPAKRVLVAPADYLRRYARFEVNQLWQNVTLSPDFPSAAQAMASLYPQSGGTKIDGVISADPFALAGFLKIIGSISVDGWPEAFTSENTSRILLYDFYAQLTADRNNERIDLQRQVAERAWMRLLEGPMPSPQALRAALADPIRQRHLQMWSARPSEQAFLERTGISGAVPPLDGDWFSAVVNNAGANKIEWFLHRTISYDATVDLRSGHVSATAVVEMQNDAPASGLATYLIGNTATPPAPSGTSIQYLSLYSPLALRSASLNGSAIDLERDTELGRNVYSAWIRIPSRGSATLSLQLDGSVQPSTPGQYSLQFGCQPLVNRDLARVHIVVIGTKPGAKFEVRGLTADHGGFRFEGPLDCRDQYLLTTNASVVRGG